MPWGEQLFRALLRGPLSTQIGNTDAWAGRTTIDSGSVSVTVSTNVVNSDSLILLGTQPSSFSGISSDSGPVVVSSINPGVGFVFTRANGVATPWDEVIMWLIGKTS